MPMASVCPKIIPSAHQSPGDPSSGPTPPPRPPQQHLLGKKSCSSLSQTSEVSSQALFTKYIYFLGETAILCFKKKKKGHTPQHTPPPNTHTHMQNPTRAWISKRKMFYFAPPPLFLCLFFFFFPLLRISRFVMIPYFEASHIRLLLFVYYSGIFMQRLIRLSLK